MAYQVSITLRSGVLLALMAAYGCTAADANGEKVRYTSAKVTLLFLDEAGKPSSRSVDIADPARVAKLAALFPELHTNRDSREAGAWLAAAQIEFRRGEELIKVLTNFTSYTVNDRGDFDAAPKLEEQVRRLFEPTD